MDKARIAELRGALARAIALWMEADYHWSLEFGSVGPRWQDHVPGDDNGAAYYDLTEILLKDSPKMFKP